MSTRLTRCVQVAVFSPLWETFDYYWPDALGEPVPGIRVVVPFGHGKRLGMVVGLDDARHDQALKTVTDRLDIQPLYVSAYMTWLQRASAYHVCSLGDMLELATAWASLDKRRRFRCLDLPMLSRHDKDLSQAFPGRRILSLSSIHKHCSEDFVQWRVLRACAQGWLEEVVEAFPAQKVDTSTRLSLRDAQQEVVDAVLKCAHGFYPALLFGRTGSGKTEVYLQLAEALAMQGRQTLILVPEIGLTPMWIKRLGQRFSRVAIWHSALGVREKIAVRHALPKVDVLLGTRSALFLPLPRLGLIVVDEEHDVSLKQQDGIAYSARDLSLLLAQALDIPVLLGSATPSLESWRQVRQGSMRCFRLTERVHAHTAIQPEIVDMRGSREVLSPQLIAGLQQVKQQGRQAMLYLNRRGYAPALQCTACGDVPTCASCSLRLSLHRKQGLLRCHACDYRVRVPQACRVCGEQAYLPLGSGTERLEDDLRKAIPDLKVARFDRDSIRNPKDLAATLSAFEAGDIDCLVGTQMLVKGHHFPNVTLVGVIHADLGMNLPDFRASERWWQQMTQVFGRTGRGAQAGRVVVQTWSPDAPWFARLNEARAEEVLDEELALRRMAGFPPFSRWVRVVFSARQFARAMMAAQSFRQALEGLEGVLVSGPMPCAIERVAGRFRVEVIVRDDSRRMLPWKLKPVLQMQKVPSGVRRKVDVDPQDLM